MPLNCPAANPQDSTAPTDDSKAGCLANELRALKAYISTLSAATATGAFNISGLTGTNTLAGTITDFTAYLQGFYLFSSTGANTGAVTLSISGLTAKSVTRAGGDPLEAGDIPANAGVVLFFVGADDRFEIVHPLISTITPAVDDNTNKLATTEFVRAQIASANQNFPSWMRGHNRLINGSFLDWRVTTNLAAGTTSVYGPTLWSRQSVGTTLAMSRQAFTYNQTDVPGYPKYFLRCVTSSVVGAANYAMLSQAMEGVQTFAGQTVTVSFWAKADAARSVAMEFAQIFGTGGSPSASIPSIGLIKFNLTTAWQRFSTTVNIPAVTGTLGSNGDDRLRFKIWLDAGTDFDAFTNSLGHQSGTFDFARVQVNEGSIILPFDDRFPQEEQLLCDRYLPSLNPEGAATAYFGTGLGSNATTAQVFIQFAVETRVPVTGVSLSAVGDFQVANGTGAFPATGISVQAAGTSKKGARITVTVASGLTASQFMLFTAANANARLQFTGADLLN